MRAWPVVYMLILFGFIGFAQASSHHPQEFLKSINGTKDEGKQIYTHFCGTCHSKKPLIALGAPRIGEDSDWSIRLKQGLDVLFKHTDEGLNSMPQRGGCFECTDAQLTLAIIEMLPNRAKKDFVKTLSANKKSTK